MSMSTMMHKNVHVCVSCLRIWFWYCRVLCEWIEYSETSIPCFWRVRGKDKHGKRWLWESIKKWENRKFKESIFHLGLQKLWTKRVILIYLCKSLVPPPSPPKGKKKTWSLLHPFHVQYILIMLANVVHIKNDFTAWITARASAKPGTGLGSSLFFVFLFLATSISLSSHSLWQAHCLKMHKRDFLHRPQNFLLYFPR